MSFLETIGFILSLIIFVVLLTRKRLQEIKKENGPEDQKIRLKKFLSDLDDDMLPKKVRIPPAPVQKRVDYPKKAYFPPVAIPIKGYHAKEKELPSRGRALLLSLKSKKDMVILHEILGPPKSRRLLR